MLFKIHHRDNKKQLHYLFPGVVHRHRLDDDRVQWHCTAVRFHNYELPPPPPPSFFSSCISFILEPRDPAVLVYNDHRALSSYLEMIVGTSGTQHSFRIQGPWGRACTHEDGNLPDSGATDGRKKDSSVVDKAVWQSAAVYWNKIRHPSHCYK